MKQKTLNTVYNTDKLISRMHACELKITFE